MVLTGRSVPADELERLGVVTKVLPATEVLKDAMECARLIAAHSGPVVQIAKQAILTCKISL